MTSSEITAYCLDRVNLAYPLKTHDEISFDTDYTPPTTAPDEKILGVINVNKTTMTVSNLFFIVVVAALTLSKII